MKVLGITAEYNPFHNGHLYQLEQAKELILPDRTIIAMSGDFTQRGEPAIADKWIRSKGAVQCGADVVFELPFVFACNRAPLFAKGGVDLLLRGGATHISFGCEAQEPEKLEEAAEALLEHGEELTEATRNAMRDGRSYAKAYESAVAASLGQDAADLIRTPNNILAVEYLKRILYWKRRGVSVEAVPIRRYGAGLGDADPDTRIAGASYLRRSLGTEDIRIYLPEETARWLLDDGMGGIRTADREKAIARWFDLLRGILLRSTPEELAEIYCVGEGLENRLQSEITKAGDLEGFLETMVSKRYTSAAIRRMLVYITMGLKGREADRILDRDESEDQGFCVPYLRMLAAGSNGREYLRELAKDTVRAESLCLITNINRQMPTGELAREMAQWDIQAADLYNALYGRRLYDHSDRVMNPYIDS